jgi:chromosome segregation ATPase
MDLPIPPDPSQNGWWPTILFVAVTVVPSLWSAYITFKSKRFEESAKATSLKIERESQRAIDKHKVEVERAVHEYTLRKEFQADLIAECEKLRLECEKMREANAKLIGVVMEKDLLIKTLTEEKETLKRELGAMKHRIEVLEAHIKSLEETRREQRNVN